MENKALRQHLEEYITQYSAELNLQPSTIENKRGVFRRLLNFLGDQPFTLDTAKAYLKDMRSRNVSPNSIKTEIRNIKAFISWLYRADILADNWGKLIVTPKVHLAPEKIVSLEIAEQIVIAGTEPSQHDHRLHREQKEEMRFALLFIIYTGLIISELKKLQGKDIDFYNTKPQFTVHTKGGNIDTLPLPAMPKEILSKIEARLTWDYVFSVSQGTLNEVLRRGCAKLGIKDVHMHLHLLRKSFCTGLGNSGASISVISKLMRHSEIGITHKLYTQYNVDELANTLNTFHPLVRQSVSEEKVFDNLLDTIKRTGLEKDSRFKLVIDRQTNELVVRITTKLS